MKAHHLLFASMITIIRSRNFFVNVIVHFGKFTALRLRY